MSTVLLKPLSLWLATLGSAVLLAACSGDDSTSARGGSSANEDVRSENESPAHLDEGGEFEDIHAFAEYLDTVGMHCEIEYEQGDGGRCLFEGKPANVFIGDSIPVLEGQTLRDFKEFGIDSFAIGWNWRVDTGYESLVKQLESAIPGVRTLYI